MLITSVQNLSKVDTSHHSLRGCFVGAAQLVQHKLRAPKRHTKALNSNKNDDKEDWKRHNEELALLAIPLASELLSFSAQLEPSSLAFFPSCAPNALPVLETLCKCFNGPIMPFPNPSTRLNAFFFHATHHPRDTSRLTIRRLCEKHCEKIFKEEANIDEFVV